MKGALIAATVAASLAIAACGSEESQEVNEPKGDFPVEVTRSKFPTRQRLAQTSNLVLGVENVGDEPLPELAFTIHTEGGGEGVEDAVADGSFNIREDNPELANPNRPVWVLENKFPRFVGSPAPKGLSPGLRAQTNTFGFGPLAPGAREAVVWRLTPVRPGTYTLNYRVEAGLDGNANAVTPDGGPVKGEFVVTISDKPPRARVNDAGEVVTEGDR